MVCINIFNVIHILYLMASHIEHTLHDIHTLSISAAFDITTLYVHALYIRMHVLYVCTSHQVSFLDQHTDLLYMRVSCQSNTT